MLRGACEEHAGQGDVFNTFLGDLAQNRELDSGHSDFWQGVVSKGITLLAEEEAEGAGISKEEAQCWLQQRLDIAKVAALQCQTQANKALAQSCSRLPVRLLHSALGAAFPSQHGVLMQALLDVKCCVV